MLSRFIAKLIPIKKKNNIPNLLINSEVNNKVDKFNNKLDNNRINFSLNNNKDKVKDISNVQKFKSNFNKNGVKDFTKFNKVVPLKKNKINTLKIKGKKKLNISKVVIQDTRLTRSLKQYLSLKKKKSNVFIKNSSKTLDFLWKKFNIKSFYKNFNILNIFVNCLMYSGKKLLAFNIYEKLLIDLKYALLKKNAKKILLRSIFIGKPYIKVRMIKVGGIKYQVPRLLNKYEDFLYSIKWIINSARELHKYKSISLNLLTEILNLYNFKGLTLQKKLNMHSLAIKGRSFIKYMKKI